MKRAVGGKDLPALPVMRLLMLSPGQIASTQILDLVFRGLADQGAIHYHVLHDNESSCAEQSQAIRDSDVIFFFRSYTPGSLSLLRLAKELGKPVLYCTDDDFKELNPETPLGRVHHQPDNLAAYASLFREADLVWLFTEEMARRYRLLNDRIIIGRLPSFIEFNYPELPGIDEAEKDCVLGYGGVSHHHVDWQVVVRPVLQVLESYKQVRVEFVNYAPEALAQHPKVRVFPQFADLRAYHQFLRGPRWSIGLAPLIDTPFNRGKTNNKFRENAGLGIPGIYSDMPVYASCIRHGETGYLAAHSEAGFHEALCAMIESSALRETIRLNALQEAASRYALRGVQLQFLREISLLAIRKQYRGWRKPRLLIVGFDGAASTHLHALQPCRQLKREELVEFSWVQPTHLSERLLDDIDAIYMVRASQPETLPLLKWAHARCLPLCSSWDDDFFTIPPGTPLGDYYHHPAVVQAMAQFLTESSLVVASTPPLVERGRAFNSHVMEAMYGLDAEGLAAVAAQPLPCFDAEKVRVGFYGVNAGIAEPWMVEALRRLRGLYGARMTVEIIGSAPPKELSDIVDWYSADLLPFEESLRQLRSRAWDIGLAPLANTVFNAAKQATKLRDYAWAGAAIVCSKTPTYERTLLHGVNCLFADNTPEAWVSAVGELINEPARINFLRRGARQLLDAVHIQDITNATWLQLIWRLGVVAAAPSPAPPPIPNVSPRVRRWGDGESGAFGYEPFVGTHRYVIVPELPGWRGVKILMGASLQKSHGILGFRVRLENGEVIREGEAHFAVGREADWVALDFSEIRHANTRRFILELYLKAPHDVSVGVFEAPHRRSRIRQAARGIGISPAKRTLCSQLAYTS